MSPTSKPTPAPVLPAKLPPAGPLPAKTAHVAPAARPLLREALGFGGTGLAFGFFLQKGRVFEPAVIQGQMLLTDFTMMRMFLSAVAASQVVFAVAELADLNGFRKTRRAYQADRGSRGIVAVAAGSALLGSGFALAGACPGTVYAQLGSAVPGAPYVLVGAAAGVMAFTLLEPSLKARVYKLAVAKTPGLEEATGLSFPTLAITSAAVLAAAAWAFDTSAPNSIGYGVQPWPLLQTGLLEAITAKAWPAAASGIAIGLLQLPSLLLSNQPLGTSSAFVAALSPLGTLASTLGLIHPSTELAAISFPSRKAGMQILQLAAMVAGAAAAARLGGTVGAVAGFAGKGVEDAAPAAAALLGGVGQAVVGGFALFMGARVAKGCTSGHGLSGFGLLNTVSLVAVPAMFAGGIATGHLLKMLYA